MEVRGYNHLAALQRRAPPNHHQPLRIPKLGSCFGGFECSSPSYLSPAHYVAFRDFSRRFAPFVDAENGAADASKDAPEWDALIEGPRALLNESQCANGLVPNWWVPAAAAQLQNLSPTCRHTLVAQFCVIYLAEQLAARSRPDPTIQVTRPAVSQ